MLRTVFFKCFIEIAVVRLLGFVKVGDRNTFTTSSIEVRNMFWDGAAVEKTQQLSASGFDPGLRCNIPIPRAKLKFLF